jgi:hypothetical protein
MQQQIARLADVQAGRRVGRISRRGLLGRVSAAGAALGMAALGGPIAPVAAREQSGIVGSWLSARTQESDLITFTADGGLVGSSPPLRPPARGETASAGCRTAPHGSWTMAAAQTFAFTFVVLEYDTQLQLSATTKVSGTVVLDDSQDSGSGSFTLTVTTAAGRAVFTDRGEMQLARIKVETAS